MKKVRQFSSPSIMKNEYEKIKLEMELRKREFKNFVLQTAQSEVQMLHIQLLSHGHKALNKEGIERRLLSSNLTV